MDNQRIDKEIKQTTHLKVFSLALSALQCVTIPGYHPDQSFPLINPGVTLALQQCYIDAQSPCWENVS